MHNFIVVGADTDGIAFKKPDEKPFTPEERNCLIEELNSYMDELIRWEDDGVMLKQLVIKTKNYVLQDENGKIKTKGSALKATTKEKALKRFIDEVVKILLSDKKDRIYSLYMKYAKEILALTDMTDWCVKKTVTKAVLGAARTNESRVLDALDQSEINEGDKVYLFNKTKTELCQLENFDGGYCIDTLLKKLYGTLSIFETVIDIDLFPNFSLQCNRDLLGLEKSQKKTTIPTDRKMTSAEIREAAEFMQKMADNKADKPKPSPFPDGFFQTRSV